METGPKYKKLSDIKDPIEWQKEYDRRYKFLNVGKHTPYTQLTTS